MTASSARDGSDRRRYQHPRLPLAARSAAEKSDDLLKIDAEWAAPILWRSEFRNLLAGYIRAGKLTLSEAEAVLQEAGNCLMAGEHAVSDHAVMKLVAKSRCTAYDCEFVALAEALGTVLVTEDKALLSAFRKNCRSLDQVLA